MCHCTNLRKNEDFGAILEEKLILDNRYTEHSTVGLAQQWDQLVTMAMRIRHNLEQQIQARNQCDVAEDALKEFSMMFRHFDMDKTGKLDLNAIKSCLRALGVLHQLVQRDYHIARMKPSLNPRTGQGITGTIVLFICYIQFLTFSLFEINTNYLSCSQFGNKRHGFVGRRSSR